MKTVALPILVTLGFVLIMGVASWFPFPFIYGFAVEDFCERIDDHPFSVDHDMYRTRLTLVSLAIAGVIIALMFLLRTGCKALDLVMHDKILLWGMFYVGIMTVLMIGGMWLDFQEYHHGPYNYSFQIGFFAWRQTI